MVRPQRLLLYRQRALVEWLGLRVVALGSVEHRQVVQTNGHIGMIEASVFLGYLKGLLGDNKGKRDEMVPLHPVVVEHLERLTSFDPVVFPWHHSRRGLYVELERIHRAAGIHLPCNENHEHTDSCYCYGFHDLRRAFATVNAETLSADALQSLMRHKSYTTTQRYINMAHQLNRSVESLHVPDVLKTASAS